LPQRRVLDLAPLLAKDDRAEQTEQLSGIIENSLRW
jgi:hydroxyacid-oxoacid transhydrogenase